MEKLTFEELKKAIYEHNNKVGVTQQYSDDNSLTCVIVFKQENFEKEYPLESRSYEFSSDNKYFLPYMLGNSIFATSLDGSDRNVRLDWYLGGWEIEYCYIKGE